METLIAILIGILFAGGVYCLLQRSLVRLVIGIMLIGQGANLLTFAASGLTRNTLPSSRQEKQPYKPRMQIPFPKHLCSLQLSSVLGSPPFA